MIAFPTDTVYGLGALPSLYKGMETLYVLKGRDIQKPLILMGADVEALTPYLSPLSSTAKALMEQYWPGQVTFLLPAQETVPPFCYSVYEGIKWVGVRIPNHSELLKLLDWVGPLATTSANISGEPSLLEGESVEHRFPEIPLVFQGAVSFKKESMILRVVGDEVLVVRD